jgi:hypothetical protein
VKNSLAGNEAGAPLQQFVRAAQDDLLAGNGPLHILPYGRPGIAQRFVADNGQVVVGRGIDVAHNAIRGNGNIMNAGRAQMQPVGKDGKFVGKIFFKQLGFTKACSRASGQCAG